MDVWGIVPEGREKSKPFLQNPDRSELQQTSERRARGRQKLCPALQGERAKPIPEDLHIERNSQVYKLHDCILCSVVDKI